MMEVWKDIPGYDGRYQISSYGRVRRTEKWNPIKRIYVPLTEPEMLTPTGNGHGYMIICLRDYSHRKNHYIHRLVAEAFIPVVEGKNHVNHIDYDRSNNIVDNLEWVDRKENVQHSLCHMRFKKPRMTNTGEMYITRRVKNGKSHYRVIVDKKERTAASLCGAIAIRDELLGGRGNVEINYSWWK